MTDNSVQFSKQDHIARLILVQNNPEQGIDQFIVQSLKEIALDINGDESIFVVVVCDDGLLLGSQRHEPGAAALIASINRPVIGVSKANLVGAGLELMLACDIRLASDNSVFSLPQILKGILPQDGGTQRLSRLVGKGKAMQMILTGESVAAKEALEIGLVNQLFAANEVHDEAMKLAVTLTNKAPIAMRYCKEAVYKGLDMSLEQGLHLEADLYFLLHTTSDRAEGVKSFLEKRKPEYQGQ